VDFRNAIIVMTSNIGSEHILNVAGDDADYEKMRKCVLQALRQHFRPEFLNRIDDLIIFHTLNKSELRIIVGLQLQRIEKLLSEQKISLELIDSAQDYLVNVGYDPVYGARPLKRAIQRELENPLAVKILDQTFIEGDTVVISSEGDGLIFTKKPPAPIQGGVQSLPNLELADQVGEVGAVGGREELDAPPITPEIVDVIGVNLKPAETDTD
jgi:ATP-dependent Clp protease ATP-binding subunit ClpB